MTKEQIERCVELAHKILDKLGYVVFVKLRPGTPRTCFECGAPKDSNYFDLQLFRAQLNTTHIENQITFDVEESYRCTTSFRAAKPFALYRPDELPMLNKRMALPNLLDLNELLTLSDEWAIEHNYGWDDAFYPMIGEYSSELSPNFPSGPIEGVGRTRQEARLTAWLKAIDESERNV